MAQRAPKGSMKLQRPVSTEAVFNLLVCMRQPDCGDGGPDGAKGAERQHEASVATHDLQTTTIDKPSNTIFILGVCFGVCFGAMLRGVLRGYTSQERHLPPIHI